MRLAVIISVPVIAILLVLATTRPIVAAEYSFQVLVHMSGPTDVTGASVQIRVRFAPLGAQADVVPWVGLSLPGNAFIQVGYSDMMGKYPPTAFWEYFPPGTADTIGYFQGGQGSVVEPNGTWHSFSFYSVGNVWYSYVDNINMGSVNLGVDSSHGLTPYAAAEVPHTNSTGIVLGPIEFRDFTYRDVSGSWHNVSEAFGDLGFGFGSAPLPSGTRFPYGLEAIGINDWLAGSGLRQTFPSPLWMGPTIGLTPTAGIGGSQIHVRGSGFLSADTACTISSPTSHNLVFETTGGLGVSAGIVVGELILGIVPPGKYVVQVTGNQGDVAQATITVE